MVNRINRSIALSLALITMSAPIVNTASALEKEHQNQSIVYDLEETETDISSFEILKVEKNSKKIEMKVNKKKYEYDIENEIISTNGKKLIQFKTTVDDINPESGLTSEECLAQEKENILNNFIEIEAKQNGKITPLYAPVEMIVPSNAAYVTVCNYSKSINKIYSELGSGLADISFITAVLTLCPKVPYKTILAAVSTATGIASYTIEKTKGYVGGTWKYTLQRTKYQYNIEVYQYAFRYAQAGISINLTIGGKTYTPYASYTSRGSWWV